MGMPKIPEGEHRPNMKETIIDLLESIALEEMALAHIINAEGEKNQEVAKLFSARKISTRELTSSCKDTQSILNSVIMKEWLLLNKMNSVMELHEKTLEQSDSCSRCAHCE